MQYADAGLVGSDVSSEIKLLSPVVDSLGAVFSLLQSIISKLAIALSRQIIGISCVFFIDFSLDFKRLSLNKKYDFSLFFCLLNARERIKKENPDLNQSSLFFSVCTLFNNH